MNKPTVFVGSSKEGLEIADAVRFHLRETALVSVWNDGIFGLSASTLDSLLSMPGKFDFAVLVLTPDDLLIKGSDQGHVPRDNVMFELGLFLGALGRSRTFAICSDSPSLRLSSDLAGITVARFGHHDAARDVTAAIGPACFELRKVIRQLGPRERRPDGSELSVVSDPRPILNAVSLIELSCTPEQPIRGSRIVLEYLLESKIEALRVWFGANLYRDDKYYYNVDEDSEQILVRGRQVHQRYLSIPPDIEPGTYTLQAEVWFGERSNPQRSIALVTRWPDRTFTLQ